ncbi:MAG TPA: hypothetical protein VEY11_12950 [Pyrinomonadaceae bacterium]|nr:hypothetical protein [Pyrinomonadaceae bacterium]
MTKLLSGQESRLTPGSSRTERLAYNLTARVNVDTRSLELGKLNKYSSPELQAGVLVSVPIISANLLPFTSARNISPLEKVSFALGT